MSQSAEHIPTKPRQRWITAALLLVAIAAGVIWYWQSQQALGREHDARLILDELGAVVVMDGPRRHVASLNLSTLKTTEDLAVAIEVLPDLLWLTSLDASRTVIDDTSLSAVDHLRRLNSLVLSGTAISDAGVARLKSLKELNSLMLARTKITSTALPSISRLRSLKILDLTGTGVTGGLEPLADLPQLEWLLLRNLSLEDGALVALAQCPGLHRLSLENSTYSAESLKVLLDKAPSLAVDE